MGTSGDVTMTNLKSATGIADDRLSAHHPNGAGNATAMSDFFVPGLGVYKDSDGDSAQEFVASWKEVNVPVGGGFCDALLCNGDTFIIGIEIHDAPAPGGYPDDDGSHDEPTDLGEHVIDAVMLGGSAWTINTQNCTVLSTTVQTDGQGTPVQVNYELEVTGYDFVDVDGRWEDGGYNKDMVHYDQTISYTTSDVESSVPTIDVTAPDSDTCCPTTINLNIQENDPLNQVDPEFYIDWGDGQTTVTQNTTPNHQYFGTGNYTVTVEMYDLNDGGYDGGAGTVVDTDSDLTEITSDGAN